MKTPKPKTETLPTLLGCHEGYRDTCEELDRLKTMHAELNEQLAKAKGDNEQHFDDGHRSQRVGELEEQIVELSAEIQELETSLSNLQSEARKVVRSKLDGMMAEKLRTMLRCTEELVQTYGETEELQHHAQSKCGLALKSWPRSGVLNLPAIRATALHGIKASLREDGIIK